MDKVHYVWSHISVLPPHRYDCGYCGENVSPNQGYRTGSDSYNARIYICHVCNSPTFIFNELQAPGAPFGDEVKHLPVDVEALYKQARDSISVSAFTGAAQLCRKVLMNVAVSQGAKPNQSFAHYVKYMADNNFIPPNAKGWVDHIRTKGNEATHEIHLTSSDEARELISFTEMLLKIVYEFPSRVPGGAASATPTPATPVGVP